jgi:hypothetical protein
MNRDRVTPLCRTVKKFMTYWKAERDIVEVEPTGHSVCDDCSSFDARELALSGRTDAEAVQELNRIESDRREHNRVQLAPRNVFDDVYLAEHRPDLMTVFNVDAPTRRQFDLPRQPKRRDVSKRLEGGGKRWESKVTGCMDAGVGTRVFVAHESVGGGPNLVAMTVSGKVWSMQMGQHCTQSPPPPSRGRKTSTSDSWAAPEVKTLRSSTSHTLWCTNFVPGCDSR